MQTLKLTKKYETYTEYKDSGIEWLGKIPESWEAKRLKDVSLYCSRGGSPEYAEDNNGYKFINQSCIREGFIDLDNIKYSLSDSKKGLIKKNDILVNSTGTGTLGRLSVFNDDDKYFADTHVTIFRSKNINSEFVAYLIQSKAWQDYLYASSVTGSTNQIELSRNKFLEIPLLLPELEKQEKIVNYLKEKTAHFDKIVEKKQKQVELLCEKRTAIINYAIAKGLDAKIELVESGIDWIGKIPKGWKIEKIKRISQMNKKTLLETTDPNFCFRYLDIGSVDEGGVPTLEDEISFEISPSRARRIISPGDSIIATVRTYLKAIAYFDEIKTNTVVSTGFAVLSPSQKLASKYLYYYLQSDRFINQVIIKSKGVSYPAITPFDLGSLEMIYPKKEVQNSIIEYLNDQVLKINLIIEKSEKSVKLLQEYKMSLIASVVTGKIKI